jgi:hypothetical protein
VKGSAKIERCCLERGGYWVRFDNGEGVEGGHFKVRALTLCEVYVALKHYYEPQTHALNSECPICRERHIGPRAGSGRPLKAMEWELK